MRDWIRTFAWSVDTLVTSFNDFCFGRGVEWMDWIGLKLVVRMGCSTSSSLNLKYYIFPLCGRQTKNLGGPVQSMFCFLPTGNSFQRQTAKVQTMTPLANQKGKRNLLVAAPLFALLVLAVLHLLWVPSWVEESGIFILKFLTFQRECHEISSTCNFETVLTGHSTLLPKFLIGGALWGFVPFQKWLISKGSNGV